MRELIVDLHIHSHFSRATSKLMNIESLYSWGKIKGINVIGTGDFTHPFWFKELKEKLEPAEDGLFKLKDEYAKVQDKQLPKSIQKNLIRFVLTVEISNIYKRHGVARRLHNVIIMPTFDSVFKFNAKLSQIGNLMADGRPILGMDSRDLLEISLTVDKNSLFIPAHIWTPWFAMFGSKSGFDSIKEAFGDMASEIKAVETGLSSDPYMNWRLSQLDGITLVSNSDAHSPAKLGREANIISCALSYSEIIDAIKTGDKRFVGTIEFFPEEGKYHYDGHRVCKVRFAPKDTKKLKGICPVCNKPLTVGVDYRVDELADREVGYTPQKQKKVEYIIPLVEMIAEVKGVKSVNSKTVQNFYEQMYTKLGDEFSVLRIVPLEDIKKQGFEKMALVIDKMRRGEIHIEPGYDGVYGVIKVFKGNGELDEKVDPQMKLI